MRRPLFGTYGANLLYREDKFERALFVHVDLTTDRSQTRGASRLKRFLIGQYGAFDEAKYSRDYRPGFYGIEACLFQNEADTQRLIRASETDGFRIGVHYPLRAGMSGTRDALFLDRDAKVRTHAFDLIQQELEYLIPVKPAYVLFHYPKPVILDDRADWAQWRFADRGEYVYESEAHSFEELVIEARAYSNGCPRRARRTGSCRSWNSML